MDELFKFIVETTFPVAVAGYLLVWVVREIREAFIRIEHKIDMQTDATLRLLHCQTCRFSPQVQEQDENQEKGQ